MSIKQIISIIIAIPAIVAGIWVDPKIWFISLFGVIVLMLLAVWNTEAYNG